MLLLLLLCCHLQGRLGAALRYLEMVPGEASTSVAVLKDRIYRCGHTADGGMLCAVQHMWLVSVCVCVFSIVCAQGLDLQMVGGGGAGVPYSTSWRFQGCTAHVVGEASTSVAVLKDRIYR
jgi:hypothetical protein